MGAFLLEFFLIFLNGGPSNGGGALLPDSTVFVVFYTRRIGRTGTLISEQRCNVFM